MLGEWLAARLSKEAPTEDRHEGGVRHSRGKGEEGEQCACGAATIVEWSGVEWVWTGTEM